MGDQPTLLQDVFDRAVRLTGERFAHILEHTEMLEFKDALSDLLARPERVIRSRSDPDARLFYMRKQSGMFGEKWLCAVVKYSTDDAFIVTAYLTDKVKPGDQLWPKE